MSGSLVGAGGDSPVQAYLTDSANETKYANANALGNPQASYLISYFTKAAPNIKSPAALLGDYRALSVVLGAYNLSQFSNSPALVKALLTQDPTSKSSVAYRSGNAAFIEFATAFKSWSPPPFSTASGVNSVLSAYKDNLFEKAANTQTPGLQNALYFTREASTVTTLTQLQSDSNLLAVAVTGVGLPLSAFDNLPFSQQTTLLQNKLKIADLQKPAYVQHLAELYLVQQQLSSSGTAAAPAAGSVASLFASSSGTNAAQGVLTILSAGDSSAGTSTLLSSSSSASNSVVSLFA